MSAFGTMQARETNVVGPVEFLFSGEMLFYAVVPCTIRLLQREHW